MSSIQRSLVLLVPLVAAGCSEFTLRDPPRVDVATPPGSPPDQTGQPPDWQDCFQGFLGEYSNLPLNHPDVEPEPPLEGEPEPPPPDFTTVDWWDQPSFQEFSPSLDFGSNWWPVDEGLEGDPAYFSVRWNAWLRAWSDTTLEFSLGSADDVWILLDGEVVFAQPGIKDFEPATYTLDLEAGQYPIEILYAHRAGQNGFRFRPLGGDISLCYAEYDADPPPAE